MKRLIATLIAVAALVPLAAGEPMEQTRERYLRFACEGITDVNRISGDEVRRMLAAGIASEDRRVVDLTLLALNNLTLLYEPALRQVQANPWNSSRPIAGVPGLKRFLMAHWLAHAEGRDHEIPMTDIARPDWFGPFPETVMENGVSVKTPREFKDRMWSVRVHSSQWDGIPMVLATHWPGDPEVLSMIWAVREYLYGQPDTDPDSFAVALFDRGRFDTPETNELREKSRTKPARTTPGWR